VSALNRRISSSLLVVALVALPLPPLLGFDGGHYVSAVILTATLCLLALRSPQGAIAALVAYLALLGDYRRAIGYFSGYPPNDPLLLVAPAAALFVLALMLLGGRTRVATTALSMVVAFFALTMFVEVFNPAQGGIAVGAAGALFYLVPMVWFWLGRAYGTPELIDGLLRRVVLPLGFAAALLGIYQSFRGLLPFESAWVKAVGFDALYITEDVVRALGFFTSSAEYTRFLLMCAAVIVAMWLKGRSKWILALPAVVVALFLASSRGPIVMLGLTATALWAVQARSTVAWLPRALAAGAIAVAALLPLLLALQAANFSDRLDAVISHQTEGLLNPTDTEKSTAVGHAALAMQAIGMGFAAPAGQGLGATTLAASKFGVGVFSAEVDVANMFYSLGIVGGFAYLAVIGLALVAAVNVWHRRRTAVELSLLAVAMSTTLSWMIGGEYAIAGIVWLAIGSIDGLSATRAVGQPKRIFDASRINHA
jgi:hypothetical protein